MLNFHIQTRIMLMQTQPQVLQKGERVWSWTHGSYVGLEKKKISLSAELKHFLSVVFSEKP